MIKGFEIIEESARVVLKRHSQPESVIKQYTKLVKNLIDHNYVEDDIRQMIEAIKVVDIKGEDEP